MERIHRTKMMWRLLTVALLWTLPLQAEEFLVNGSLISKAADATREKYPDADDVLIEGFTQVEYQPDGTSETWDDTAIKILTEKGKRDYRTLTLGFNISYGTNRFTRVEIIKPDGTVQPIDIERQSKIMADSGQMKVNIYNPNSKILKLSVPGLEVGDILRYVSHEVRNKTVVPDAWSDYQVFEHTSPFRQLTYRVIAPTALPLRKIALKDEIPGTVSFSEESDETGNRMIYTWEVRNVPRMFDEPNMPQRNTVVQRLLVSTMESWEELSQWYWSLCEPRLDAVTPEMEAMANELIEGCTNTLEKIEAVFNFVSQDIRYMGITTEEEAPGYEPHDVCITFTNRYGVCRDKAALLATMLRMVDIEAFPVIIMAGPKKDEEVPQPFFNHAVTAALGDQGEYILMDSTDENTRDIFPSYLQNMSYLVARPEGETLLTSPVIPAADNLVKITTEGSLDRTGSLNAQTIVAFEGINDTVYRGHLSKIKPEERKRFFEGELRKSIPTAELTSLEILPTELRDTSRPLVAKLEFTADHLLIEGEEHRILNVPRLGGSIGYVNFLLGQTGLEERKYPLYTRMTAGISETMELKMPEKGDALKIPDYELIDNDQISWHMEAALQNDRLITSNTFMIHTVEFTPNEYLELKKQLREIEYNLRKKLILEPGDDRDSPDADVQVLEKETRITLTDAQHWEETGRTRAKILTYAGTKKFSDIKVPYNPAWQEVELKHARVTLPDGSVKNIRAEEINVMDAPWTASAPRYPTGKILVANLPGVEVGCVIDYEIVSRVRNKPFFSTTITFNGHEPVDHQTYTLTAPASLDMTIRNTGISETITTNNESISYSWTAEHQPAVRMEENLPAWWTFNPAVFISTGEWKTYGHDLLNHLTSVTENQPACMELAHSLTDGLTNDTEKVIALRNWTATHLRPAGPTLIDLPFSAISWADRTLEEGYGNNTDRMVVLYTMLKGAGLSPEFILSGQQSLIPEATEPLLSIPSRTAFNALLVRVTVDGDTVYLSGVSQYAELGASPFHRRPMLDLQSGAVDTVRVPLGKDDRSYSTMEISIGPDGGAGFTESIAVQGTAFEKFKKVYAEITPENRRRHYLELVAGISQSATAVSDLVTEYDTYPGKLAFSVIAERYAVLDGDYLYFTIPTTLSDKILGYRSSERTLPLAWNNYINSLNEINILLPDGYEPVIFPKAFSWQAPDGAGMVDVSSEYSRRAHAIRVVEMTDLKPALIPADLFPELVEAGKRLSHPDMHTILLKRKADSVPE